MIDSSISFNVVHRALRFCLFTAGATFVVACNAVEPEGADVKPAVPLENATTRVDVVKEPSVSNAEKSLRLDFNGDGAQDDAYLLSAVSLSDPAFANARQQDLWSYETDPASFPAAEKKRRVFLVKLSSAGESADSLFLLFSEGDAPFLDSVSADDVSLIKQQDLVADYPELADASKGDGLMILTEAGIDAFIYWNGESFGFYEPEEIP